MVLTRGATWAAGVAAVFLATVTILAVLVWPVDDPVGGPVAAPEASAAESLTVSAAPVPSLSDEDQAVAVYAEFNSSVRAIRLAPPDQRAAGLSGLVTDSYAQALLRNMAKQEAAGITLWGEGSRILSATAAVSGDTAHLVACLDGSRGGEADSQTGEHLTVGPPRNPAQATLRRDDQGSWLVDDELFPGGSC